VIFILVGDFMKKEYRVKKSSEIEKIMRIKQSKANGHFVIYKNKNHENTHFRFAVSVSKKYGNAVYRNKIKRQVREIISKMDIMDNYDLFIVVRVKANLLSFNESKDLIESLVKKLNILR
jgi:ribonuclease P protein component